MSVRTLVGRAARLDRDRRRMLVSAVAALAGASAAVRFLPFRRAIRFGLVSARAGKPADTGSLIDRAVWAVETASRILPVRAKCIQKGLALQQMLRRRGVAATLHYGVGIMEDDELKAHVWVSVQGQTILGGMEAPMFQCLATYP